MDKELSYQFVRGYVQSFKDSAVTELKKTDNSSEGHSAFVRGQIDACRCILRNMGTWE